MSTIQSDKVSGTSTPLLRKPTPREAAIIDALLAEEFEGVVDLRAQARGLLVRQVFEDGTLDLIVPASAPAANVSHRVPVEAQCDDADGLPILILLHVIDGRLNELEIVKGDGSGVRQPPSADRLDVVVRGRAFDRNPPAEAGSPAT